ncbi:tetracycline resistance MFS efflux pump [Aliidongia dinghuensis]|uniref:Tetracycline resistance MFS efflux pump n=1 Tax=Aliidongia dinghuensis TaxID=1867774 RepID=A0A8J2YSK2_9PROT|nr:TCR/Tet family MFS transporter [Aliidongia dinghuensis]GGF15823.1 tetracycline resistance MFS efflux pump [Aliidongia dinghuensis]
MTTDSEDRTARRGARAPAPAFIMVTVGLDVLALGLIIPVLPRLVVDFLGGDTEQGAEILGLFGTVWALMQFLAGPVLGSLSDRVGRRPVILLSNVGLGLDYVLMALAPNLSWLFVGRIISGITGASITTSFAYIADVTPAEGRPKAYGMLGAAFGIGFIVGPAIGGLLGNFDPRLPFWCAAGFSLLNAAYGWFVLPESLPRDRRAGFSWRRANPVGALALLRSRPGLLGLAGISFLFNLAHESLPAAFVLYATYRYHWDKGMIGLTLAGVGVCSAVVQGGLIGPIVGRLGAPRALVLGLVAGAVGFAIYGLAETGPLFWVGMPVMAFWGVAGAALQGIASTEVDPTEQGQLQGALQSVRGIAGLIGPGLYTLAFAYAIGAGADWHQPGLPYLIAALCLVAALGLAGATVRRRRAIEAT